MAGLVRDVFFSPDVRTHITEVIADVCRLIERQNIVLADEYVKECIDEVIQFYKEYLSELNTKFSSPDHYKIISWFCVFIASRLEEFQQGHFETERISKTTTPKKQVKQNYEKVVECCVFYMFDMLETMDHRRLIEPAYKMKIINMVVYEISHEDGRFGIGKNGLYMLMKLASVVEVCE